MDIILSYLISHIYELHSLLAATVVLLLMTFIKRPIKKYNINRVERKIIRYPELAEKQEIMVRHGNMILILLTMVLSALVFAFFSILSPFIEFSFFDAVMSGVFALCEYAFVEQITFGRGE